MVSFDNLPRFTKFFFWLTLSPAEYDVLDTNRKTLNSNEWVLPPHIPDFRAEMHRRNAPSSATSTPHNPRTYDHFGPKSKIPPLNLTGSSSTEPTEEVIEYNGVKYKVLQGPSCGAIIQKIKSTKSQTANPIPSKDIEIEESPSLPNEDNWRAAEDMEEDHQAVEDRVSIDEVHLHPNPLLNTYATYTEEQSEIRRFISYHQGNPELLAIYEKSLHNSTQTYSEFMETIRNMTSNNSGRAQESKTRRQQRTRPYPLRSKRGRGKRGKTG
jgi:hypothetical protein